MKKMQEHDIPAENAAGGEQLLCRELSLGYSGKAIIENLSFSVRQGDYLCIAGENGCGKTTLMKTLLGLQPPIRGEVLMGDGLRANQIGYLPQQTTAQKDFPAAVSEIVLSGCQGRRGLRPFYTAAEKRLAKENLELMGLADERNRCYRELSGGQQQRVLLARALCATQKMLLLDEPVSGLDPKVTAEMYRLVQQLNRRGLTVLMISHDLGSALKYAGTILYLEKGKVFFGSPKEYLARGQAQPHSFQKGVL